MNISLIFKVLTMTFLRYQRASKAVISERSSTSAQYNLSQKQTYLILTSIRPLLGINFHSLQTFLEYKSLKTICFTFSLANPDIMVEEIPMIPSFSLPNHQELHIYNVRDRYHIVAAGAVISAARSLDVIDLSFDDHYADLGHWESSTTGDSIEWDSRIPRLKVAINRYLFEPLTKHRPRRLCLEKAVLGTHHWFQALFSQRLQELTLRLCLNLRKVADLDVRWNFRKLHLYTYRSDIEDGMSQLLNKLRLDEHGATGLEELVILTSEIDDESNISLETQWLSARCSLGSISVDPELVTRHWQKLRYLSIMDKDWDGWLVDCWEFFGHEVHRFLGLFQLEELSIGWHAVCYITLKLSDI